MAGAGVVGATCPAAADVIEPWAMLSCSFAESWRVRWARVRTPLGETTEAVLASLAPAATVRPMIADRCLSADECFEEVFDIL